MVGGDSFIALRGYFKGLINKWELIGTDDAISEVRENSQNRGLSELHINLGDDGVLKLLGVNDDDIWFYNSVNSYYSNYEFIDSYQVESDFKEGYGLWRYVNEDNRKLFEKISKFVFNKELDFNDEESLGEFGKFLLDTYPTETERILSEFATEKNHEMSQVAQEHMQTDIKREIANLGYNIRNNDTIVLTVGELTELFLRYDGSHLPIKKLFQEIHGDEDGSNIGGWSEDIYDYQKDEYFNFDSFNRDVEWNLEKIVDSLEDEMGEDKIREFTKMVSNITKRFNIGVMYSLPKNGRYKFRIDGFDRETMKIIVNIIKDGKRKIIKLSEENFFNLLYQPELFDFEELYGFGS